MSRQDLRFQLRAFIRQPLFALVSIGTLALGIGANVAMFSVVRAALLRPLPYPDGDRLVQIRGLDRKEGTAGNLSPADFLDFQRESSTCIGMGAHGWVGSFTIGPGRPSRASDAHRPGLAEASAEAGPGDAERVGGVNVTDGFFPTLGVQPAHGRGFRADEDVPGGSLVAYPEGTQMPFYARLLERVTGLPGVRGAGRYGFRCPRYHVPRAERLRLSCRLVRGERRCSKSSKSSR